MSDRSLNLMSGGIQNRGGVLSSEQPRTGPLDHFAVQGAVS
jgi:hypothetical protein